jgi:hypothetical protein
MRNTVITAKIAITRRMNRIIDCESTFFGHPW